MTWSPLFSVEITYVNSLATKIKVTTEHMPWLAAFSCGMGGGIGLAGGGAVGPPSVASVLDMWDSSSLSHPFSDILTHGHFYFRWPSV